MLSLSLLAAVRPATLRHLLHFLLVVSPHDMRPCFLICLAGLYFLALQLARSCTTTQSIQSQDNLSSISPDRAHSLAQGCFLACSVLHKLIADRRGSEPIAVNTWKIRQAARCVLAGLVRPACMSPGACCEQPTFSGHKSYSQTQLQSVKTHQKQAAESDWQLLANPARCAAGAGPT